jgi:hypothetical protein
MSNADGCYTSRKRVGYKYTTGEIEKYCNSRNVKGSCEFGAQKTLLSEETIVKQVGAADRRLVSETTLL